jgi:predicted RNase H-like nuclease (RuvC/YqgF family)
LCGLKTENQGLKDKVQGLIKRERKEVVGREQDCNAYKLQLEKMMQECEDLNAMLSSTQTSQQELSKMLDNTVKVKHTEDELSENGALWTQFRADIPLSSLQYLLIRNPRM